MATTNGTLTSKISSMVSSPTVHYAVSYEAKRSSTTEKTVTVTVNFSTRLNSSGSRLGTGIKLTAFVRVNNGTWKSVVLKSASASWSGTGVHNASVPGITFSTAASNAKVEFYISRTGSTGGGTAGTLGSASSPKKYTATLPAYTEAAPAPTPTPTPTPAAEKYVYVNVSGVWKKAVPYINVSGTWKKTEPYINASGVWKEVG